MTEYRRRTEEPDYDAFEISEQVTLNHT